jgi:teichuronic acid biosynthesis glycosyltransferase TuaC
MKILFITNSYPTERSPDYGVFTKEQIEHIVPHLDDHKIIFINAREKGWQEYIRAFSEIKKNHKKYDLMHCFHGLSLVTSFLASKKTPLLVSFLSSLATESKTRLKFFDLILKNLYDIILKSERVYPLFKDKLPENTFYSKKSFYLPNGVNLEISSLLIKKACKKIGIPVDKIMYFSFHLKE